MKYVLINCLMFLLWACTNPFDTREPDRPEINSRPQPVNSLQNDPDSLLTKIQLAFADLDINYYEDCLIDTGFAFVPQQDEAYRLVPWSRQDEVNYFSRLRSNQQINKIALQVYNVQEWIPIGATQDDLQTRFSYEIELSFPTRKEIYRGQSIYRIKRSSQSLYYIYYWEDLKLNSDQQDSTWSTLKANYR